MRGNPAEEGHYIWQLVRRVTDTAHETARLAALRHVAGPTPTYLDPIPLPPEPGVPPVIIDVPGGAGGGVRGGYRVTLDGDTLVHHFDTDDLSTDIVVPIGTGVATLDGDTIVYTVST